jgi:hypothetical protein
MRPRAHVEFHGGLLCSCTSGALADAHARPMQPHGLAPCGCAGVPDPGACAHPTPMHCGTHRVYTRARARPMQVRTVWKCVGATGADPTRAACRVTCSPCVRARHQRMPMHWQVLCCLPRPVEVHQRALSRSMRAPRVDATAHPSLQTLARPMQTHGAHAQCMEMPGRPVLMHAHGLQRCGETPPHTGASYADAGAWAQVRMQIHRYDQVRILQTHQQVTSKGMHAPMQTRGRCP